MLNDQARPPLAKDVADKNWKKNTNWIAEEEEGEGAGEVCVCVFVCMVFDTEKHHFKKLRAIQGNNLCGQPRRMW